MAILKLKHITLDQFKGVDHAEYDFYDRTLIEGSNGTGKTTIADAVTWLFTDKDYSLVSNPEIHNMFLSESEPSVTIVCNIDGKKMTLRKFQKDSRTKKQKEACAPVRISNQYEVNEVPKSQKDFVAALDSVGIALDGFLLLSHPDIFTGQKSADCRKILFGMVTDISDKEIADKLTEFKETAELLNNYTVEEITAMKKREKKEASENLDVIPEQIIGMEKSKVNIDVDEFKVQRETLQNEVDVLEEKIREMRIPSISELNQERAMYERELKTLTAEMNSERVAKLTALNAEIGELKRKLNAITEVRSKADISLNSTNEEKNALAAEYNELSRIYTELKEKDFEMPSNACPYCGQSLPVYMIAKAKDKFEEDKANRLEELKAKCGKVRKKYEALNKTIPLIEKDIAEIAETMKSLSEEIGNKEEDRKKYETVIPVDGTPESAELRKKIDDVQSRINNRDTLVAQADRLDAELRENKQIIRDIDDQIAQVKVNEKIDSQIAELRQKQKEYSQAEADAEKILHQLSEISMKKNEMLTEQVNSHFEMVRFKLFEQQKNGDFKDCCIPTIRNESGEYMVLGESANTALAIMGKLDIISGLQKLYDKHVPVILDGAECLDQKSMASLKIDTQLITLSVTDTPLTVKGE